MLHLVYGGDEYAASEAVALLLKDLVGDRDINSVNRIDGSTITWTRLREACGSLTLFAEKQVIVVRDLLAGWSGRGDTGAAKAGATKPSAAEFAQYVAALPVSTELILREADLSPSNRYLKELSELPSGTVRVQAYSVPKDESAREAWAQRRIRDLVEKRGGSIDGRALRVLAQRCGADFLQASHEVDKLLAFTAPLYSIMMDDVEALVAESTETRGFDLVDAVAAKRAAVVVDLTDRLLGEGQAPEQIMALMSARIHDLSLLASGRAEGVLNDVVVQKAGWPAWRARQLERTLQSFTLAELTSAQAILLAADLALKSRPSHERPLATLLALLAIARRSDPKELEAALAYY